MLPRFNGASFFDHPDRCEIHLFTDASGIGLGGFYYPGEDYNWKTSRTLIIRDGMFARKLEHEELEGSFDINIYEVLSTATAFEIWKDKWRGTRVVVHTDSQTCFNGLKKNRH